MTDPEDTPAWDWAGDVLDACEGLAAAERAARRELAAVKGLDPAVDVVLEATERLVRLVEPS